MSPVQRLAVDIAVEGTVLPVARTRVADAARVVLRDGGVRDALLSLAFISAPAIARLNREHLGHRGPTDVISFGLGAGLRDGPVIGDVYICPDVARTNAARHAVGVREELLRLVIHGTLHVLGGDHPDGDDRDRSDMWKRQERLLRRVLRSGTRSTTSRR